MLKTLYVKYCIRGFFIVTFSTSVNYSLSLKFQINTFGKIQSASLNHIGEFILLISSFNWLTDDQIKPEKIQVISPR